MIKISIFKNNSFLRSRLAVGIIFHNKYNKIMMMMAIINEEEDMANEIYLFIFLCIYE